MKTKVFLARIWMVAVIATAFSCSKHSETEVTPAGIPDALATTWHTSSWGGVSNNYLIFKIDAGTASGMVNIVSVQSFGFAIGDKILTGIKANADGSFSATGKYTYGTNSESSGTRACTMTLQNNNAQLTIDYPAINASFPEVVYVYQKGAVG